MLHSGFAQITAAFQHALLGSPQHLLRGSVGAIVCLHVTHMVQNTAQQAKNKIVNYSHLCHKCCKNVESLRLRSDEITSKVSSKLYQRYITKTGFSAIKENLPTLCLNVFVKFIINAVNKCIDCTQCLCIPSKSLDKNNINALISHVDGKNEILQCEKSCL